MYFLISLYSWQEPITRSEHLPYLLLELSFLQTELFLERLSRQANNAFVYWPTRAPHYFCNKWINYLDFPTFINMADSSDEFESDLSCESEYESVESSDEWESESSSEEEEVDSDSEVVEGGKRGVPSGSVSSKSKLKITRSVKTISQPKRERCSLLVMGSCRDHHHYHYYYYYYYYYYCCYYYCVNLEAHFARCCSTSSKTMVPILSTPWVTAPSIVINLTEGGTPL